MYLDVNAWLFYMKSFSPELWNLSVLPISQWSLLQATYIIAAGLKPTKRKKNYNSWMLGISGVGCGEMAMNSGATEIWSESGLPFWWVLWLWVKPLNLSEPHFSLQTQAYEWGPHGGGLEVNEAQKTESRRLGIGIPSIDIFSWLPFHSFFFSPSLFSSLLQASVHAISL